MQQLSLSQIAGYAIPLCFLNPVIPFARYVKDGYSCRNYKQQPFQGITGIKKQLDNLKKKGRFVMLEQPKREIGKL